MICAKTIKTIIVVILLFISNKDYAQSMIYDSGGDINCMLLGFTNEAGNTFPGNYSYSIPPVHNWLFNHTDKFSKIKQVSYNQIEKENGIKYLWCHNLNFDNGSKLFSTETIGYSQSGRRNEYIYDTMQDNLSEFSYIDNNTVTENVHLHSQPFTQTDKIKYFYSSRGLIDSVNAIRTTNNIDTECVTAFFSHDSINRLVSIVCRVDTLHNIKSHTIYRTVEHNIYTKDTSDFFDLKNISYYFPDTVFYADLLRGDPRKKIERLLVIDTVTKMVRHILKSSSFLIECHVTIYPDIQDLGSWGRNDDLSIKSTLDRGYFVFPSPRQKISMFISQPQNKNKAYSRMETFLFGRDLNYLRTTTRVLNYKSKMLLIKYHISFISKYESSESHFGEGKIYHNSCSYRHRIKNGLVTGFSEFRYTLGTALDQLNNPDKFIVKTKIRYGF